MVQTGMRTRKKLVRCKDPEAEVALPGTSPEKPASILALAAIASNVSYWNWYGFPYVYTAGYMFIQIIGFLCVGIVAALSGSYWFTRVYVRRKGRWQIVASHASKITPA
jgi:hypothetical protein